MLVLFETPAGYALFSAKDKKLAKVDDIFKHLVSAEAAGEVCVPALPAAPQQRARSACPPARALGGADSLARRHLPLSLLAH